MTKCILKQNRYNAYSLLQIKCPTKLLIDFLPTKGGCIWEIAVKIVGGQLNWPLKPASHINTFHKSNHKQASKRFARQTFTTELVISIILLIIVSSRVSLYHQCSFRHYILSANYTHYPRQQHKVDTRRLQNYHYRIDILQ